MYKRIALAIAPILILLTTPAHSIVTYVFVPTKPSLEGYNFKGTFEVTSEALQSGSASLEMFLCYDSNEPITPKCLGFNSGVHSIDVGYVAPSGEGWGGSNFFDPVLESFPDLGDLSLSASLTETEAEVYFRIRSINGGYMVSTGDEIYVFGTDNPIGCAYSDRTRDQCRGGAGRWVRVPEPPTIAFLALGVIALGFHLRSHKRS